MLGLHDGGSILGAEEIGGVVDAGDEVEILLFQLIERAGTNHTGIADEDVQAAEVLHSLLEQVGDALLIGHVDLDAHGALAHFGGDRRGQLFVQIGDDDARAFLVHFLGDALAEALRAAGHDGDFAGQATRCRGAVMDVCFGDLLPFLHVDHGIHPPQSAFYGAPTHAAPHNPIVTQTGRNFQSFGGFLYLFF